MFGVLPALDTTFKLSEAAVYVTHVSVYARAPDPPEGHRPPDATVMLQLAGMRERKYATNAERQAAYRERRDKREYDERRARAKDYAATLGDALGWDEKRVEEALVRVGSHEDGLVAAELALQAFVDCAEVAVIDAEP